MAQNDNALFITPIGPMHRAIYWNTHYIRRQSNSMLDKCSRAAQYHNRLQSQLQRNKRCSGLLTLSLKEVA